MGEVEVNKYECTVWVLLNLKECVCVSVCVHVHARTRSVTQSCPTLCDPTD